MKQAFFGLKDFFQFLSKTKTFLESESAIKRLAWEKVNKSSTKGVWVQLIEPSDNPNASEEVFKIFLDANNQEIYQAGDDWVEIGSSEYDCLFCINSKGKPLKTYKTIEHATEAIQRICEAIRRENEALEDVNAENITLTYYHCEKGSDGFHIKECDHSKRPIFFHEYKLRILDRDEEKEQLLLERYPAKPFLIIRPNTYQLERQIDAIQKIQSEPREFQRPLLRLLESADHAYWQTPNAYSIEEKFWYILTDSERLGSDAQREFVLKALSSPDFTFCEGPPGSGKTTTICELILQLAEQGKRVLLCASTHVAVDNVIERLMDKDTPHRDKIIPLRIGKDKRAISEKVQQFLIQEFIPTERKRILMELKKKNPLTAAQEAFQKQLSADERDQTIERMILDCANLICGTTIGILQHPDIKYKEDPPPQFDVLIIDEASKTTFQEFLVPALLAKKWVLVGDPKQLSPYVEDDFTAVNLRPCLPEKFKRNSCVDAFYAGTEQISKHKAGLICSDNSEEIEFYHQQAEKCGALACTTSNTKKMLYADLVIDSADNINKCIECLPLDITYIRDENESLSPLIHYRVAAYNKLKKRERESAPIWENELAWRIARIYEQRHNNNELEKESGYSSGAQHQTRVKPKPNKTIEKRNREIKKLLPFDDTDGNIEERINNVKRIALPSILESLQDGFERNKKQKRGTALTDGFPKDALQDRHVQLTAQHRMHPDIARFPREYIYNNDALHTSDDMIKAREWSYRPGQNKVIWLDIESKPQKNNSNNKEADAILTELEEFNNWAGANHKDDGKDWVVAILSFYRGQENEIRKKLRKWTNNREGRRHFRSKNNVEIQLCTVDKFQGHEADYVLLSFVKDHKTDFLESPNRLNVAITRARYKMMIFGNAKAMEIASGVLGPLAITTHREKKIGKNDD